MGSHLDESTWNQCRGDSPKPRRLYTEHGLTSSTRIRVCQCLDAFSDIIGGGDELLSICRR